MTAQKATPKTAGLNVKNRTIFTDKRGLFTPGGKRRKDDIGVLDNLHFMRGMNSECVDLIYLDPPFNSKKEYRAPLGGGKHAVFDDTWSMDMVKAEWVYKIAVHNEPLAKVLDTAGAFGHKSNKAYLIYMAVRLLEMRRLLKPAGSIYLHCDPTMSHWLKLVMDAVFGEKNFRNDITWVRHTKPKHSPDRFGNFNDHLLFYAKSEKAGFTPQKTALCGDDEEKKFPLVEEETKRRFYWRALGINRKTGESGAVLRFKGKKYTAKHGWQWGQKTLDERFADNPLLVANRNGTLYFRQYASGIPVHTNWADILPISAGETTGYKTQKPLELLERIIRASSNKGDVVLDPFCGCVTACIAAEKLGRQWIGMDVSPVAYEMVKKRLVDDLQMTVRGENKHEEQRTLMLKNNGDQWRAYHRCIPPMRDDAQLLDLEKDRTDVIKELSFIQDGYCNGCGEHFGKRHFETDHITPKAFGGLSVPTNLQLLCGACNRQKGTKTMEEFIALRKSRHETVRDIPESEYLAKERWELQLGGELL